MDSCCDLVKKQTDIEDEDSNDSIIEVDKEECELCGGRFKERHEVIIHIAQKYFEQELLNELLSEGWEEGEQTCPVCDVTPEIRAKWVNDKHE